MKLIYLFSGGMKASGVQKKVISKIQTLNDLGVETKGLFISDNAGKFYPEYNIQEIPYKIDKVPKIYGAPFMWRFHIYHETKVFFQTIDQALQKEDFDLILFRYPIWYADFNFLRFMKKYRDKIIFEHNTIEVVEMKAYEQNDFRHKYLIFNEKKIAPRAMKYAKGIVGVCGEITDYEVNRVSQKVTGQTISNGFKVATVSLRTPPKFDQQNLNILFSSGFPGKWHGLDRLIEGLNNYKGNVNIQIKVIGDILDAVKDQIKKYGLENQIELLGQMNNEKAAEVFNQCHIGASSMGMHRNGVQEAATLKTREYLSRGIPFFISNVDVDLINKPEIAPFYLKIPGDNTPVDIEKVVNFAREVLKDGQHPLKMRNFAENNIAYKLKMQQLKDFLENLHHN
ncbi:hypothetical protein BKI52_21090 [marine bacterium AO1-C]|nr:hypothetical protein BKI52_21090 [marine bacterium AO1-C]